MGVAGNVITSHCKRLDQHWCSVSVEEADQINLAREFVFHGVCAGCG
jgi:hypothetical protein